jgi:3-methyladenine DNA glycosylase AlkD
VVNRLSSAACAYTTDALAAAADPKKAEGMQAYLKTDMPFYGVQKPDRVGIVRHLVKTYPPPTRDDYEDLVTALWSLPHREEKYTAVAIAKAHRAFIVLDSLPLYRRLIVEGAWWDFVDEVAIHLVGRLVVEHADEAWAVVDAWIDDEDMWLRRTSIICQVGAKEDTDIDRLFGFCERRAFEKESFIRKAIGWALRDYARTDPDAVAAFVRAHRDDLSGLSFREATKHIGHLVAG